MSFEMPVEGGKIREFARATHAANRAYHASDAVVPPTFLTTAHNLWAPLDESPIGMVGFDMGRVLHGEEEYEFFGVPPRAGQTLTVSTRVSERWEKEGKRGGTMRFARVVTEYRDSSGTSVAEQRTTVIETAKPPTTGE